MYTVAAFQTGDGWLQFRRTLFHVTLHQIKVIFVTLFIQTHSIHQVLNSKSLSADITALRPLPFLGRGVSVPWNQL